MIARLVAAGALVALAPAIPAHPPTGRGAAQPATQDASACAAAAAVDAFHSALRRGDTRSAARLLADDALIFEGGAVERSKAEYSAHHLPADAAFSQTVTSVVTRRSCNANGNFAWIASEGRTTGTYRGRPVDQTTTETMLLRRTGRSWKIVHIHWSSGAIP